MTSTRSRQHAEQLFEREVRAARCAALAGLLLGCGARPMVVAFAAPAFACPGREVTVTWVVRGRATLRAARGDASWDESEVPSTGQRTLVTRETTELTLRALDARPEEKSAYAVRTLEVPEQGDERTALATCAGSECSGALELGGAGALRVVALSEPHVVIEGEERPVSMCATSPAGQRTCVGEGEHVAIDTAAAGRWTLTASLPESPEVPPELLLHFDMHCI